MGTINTLLQGDVMIDNVINLDAYRRYRIERQQTWRPLYCPVCGHPATEDLSSWIYSYSVNHFVCGELCYEKAEDEHDTRY